MSTTPEQTIGIRPEVFQSVHTSTDINESSVPLPGTKMNGSRQDLVTALANSLE
jgi:hypothetical protein